MISDDRLTGFIPYDPANVGPIRGPAADSITRDEPTTVGRIAFDLQRAVDMLEAGAIVMPPQPDVDWWAAERRRRAAEQAFVPAPPPVRVPMNRAARRAMKARGRGR